LNNRQTDRDKQNSDPEEERSLRILHYRLYRLRKSMRTFWRSLLNDFNEKTPTKKLKFIAEMVGIIILGIYTVYTGAMYHANRDSADAAMSAAITADKTLKESIAASRLDQRPWVGIEGVVVSEPIVNDSVNHQLRSSIVFTMRNTGKSPANNVIPQPVLTTFSNQRPKQNEACADTAKPPFGINIYTGQVRQQPIDIHINQSEVDAASVPSNIKKLVPLMVVGCIFYQGPAPGEIYKTGFSYSLVTRSRLIFSLSDLPKETPVLVEDLLGSFFR
jgi:hypothetical protein